MSPSRSCRNIRRPLEPSKLLCNRALADSAPGGSARASGKSAVNIVLRCFLIDPRSVSRLLLLSTLVSGSVLAQQPKPRADSDYQRRQAPAAPPLPAALTRELAVIRDAALTDDYAYRLVAHLTENIGPRPVGSLQAQAAIEPHSSGAGLLWPGFR